jgi:hypothetical protein
MDTEGYIFDVAPYFSGDVYFKFFGKTSGDAANPGSPLGLYFLPINFEQFMSFKENIIKMGVKPSALVIKDGDEAELYLSARGALIDAPKILFKFDTDFNTLAENLQAALTTEPLQSDFVKKYASLLYLDLRFDNKVYYKFSAQGGSASGGN